MRFPLRISGGNRDVATCDINWAFEGRALGPRDTVIAFHNTQLASLVHPSIHGFGLGILMEQRFRFGICTHNGNAGVNVYADGGIETFGSSSGWVSLEVECCNTTALRGGRPGRYCVRGPGGDICRKVALRALWVPYEEVPDMMKVA